MIKQYLVPFPKDSHNFFISIQIKTESKSALCIIYGFNRNIATQVLFLINYYHMIFRCDTIEH